MNFLFQQSAKVKSLIDRLTALQLQQAKPTIPDRPRLKDYLATMKPDTWGSTKVDENIYRSSPIPNMNHAYYHSMPTSIQPSLPMPYAPPPSLVQPMPFAYQPSGYSQPHSNFIPSPAMHYNPHPPAQPYPIYPPASTQTIPMHQPALQNPSMYQYSRPPLPAKFDPYRPQPVGAYDIPTTQPPSFLNPQDVYRPGGLLGMTQQPMSTANYDPNQYVQYIPSSAASSFSNLSINPMSNH